MTFLDSASTTKPKFFRKDYSTYWFNSNMFYSTDEQTKVQEAEDRVKRCLGVKGGHVLWFRCATEAAQWLIGQLKYWEEFDTTFCYDIEHDSIWDLCLHLSDLCDEDEMGTGVTIHHFTRQYINQMTGVIFEMGEKDKGKNKHFFFFSDFTAAIGHVKVPTNLEEVCDAVWFSGHKFHTEKGIGAMWVSDELFDYLGGTDSPRNQYGFVHGTLDVAGCLMLADAMEHACENIDNKEAEWKMLSDIILRDLQLNDIDCRYIADDQNRTHAINALCINGVEADALANYLALKEIYVSVGHSACADNTDYRVLEVFGCSKKEASEVIRVSFDEDTTIHDVKGLIETIIEFKRRFI